MPPITANIITMTSILPPIPKLPNPNRPPRLTPWLNCVVSLVASFETRLC